MTKKYKLTPEHKKQLKPWADKWIKNALSTRRTTKGEKEEIIQQVNKLYGVSGLEKPLNVVFVDSPITGAFAACFASCIWYLRDNPEKLKEILGGTWAATRAATRAATEDATRAATGAATWADTGAASRTGKGCTKKWFCGEP